MIAVDTNILVYAHRVDSPFHDRARLTLESLAVGVRAWPSSDSNASREFAEMGLITDLRPRSCARPMRPDKRWLAQKSQPVQSLP